MDEAQYAALLQARENFRPEHALETKEDFDRFYVPRPLSPLAELEVQIRHASQEAKFLVYGHRGCGKTSELNQLALSLVDSHFAVVLSLEDEHDLSDIHYTELLTALCRTLIYQANRHGLDVSKNLLTDVLAWFDTSEEIVSRELSAEGSATEKVSLYFFELFSKQKAELSKRHERRHKNQENEGELLVLINRLITEVRAADAVRCGHERPLFAIVDTLDRYKVEVVKEVFKNTAALRAPNMTMIYTVPLAYSRDQSFSDVLRDFGDHRCTIPILTLFTMDGQRDERAWGLAYAILELRRAGVEMTNAVQNMLIAGSGGVLSVLFTLCYSACVAALARNSPAVTEQIARDALIDRRERFYEFLDEADYQTLSQKMPNRMPKVDDRFRKLIYESCILEHATDGKHWYDLHPLVRELVDEWRTERAAEPSNIQDTL